MKNVKRYDQAFKEQAVRLVNERNNVLSVARELGVSCSQLARWRHDYIVLFDKQQKSHPGKV